MVIMKRIFSIFVAVATLVLAACSTDTTSDFNYTVMGEDVVLEFDASVSADSRTQLVGQSIHWNAEDAIAVFAFDGTSYSAPSKFTIKNAESYTTAAVATFVGETVTAQSYLAVYPYSETLEIVDGCLKANIPSEQTAVKDSFDAKAALAVAVATSKDMKFKNICSYLKVTASNDGSISVKSNDGTTFTGDITVSSPETAPVVENPTEAFVTLSGCQSGNTYYIATAPATIEGGITLYNNGSMVKQTANTVVLEKGKIHEVGDNALPEAVSGLVLVGNHNNWDINSGTPVYEVGGYYVATCTNSCTEFKFVQGENWIGGAAESTSAVNEWLATGGNNIIVSSDAQTFEVYLKKNFSSYLINTTGEPIAPFTVSIIGAISSISMNWDSDLTLKYDQVKSLYYTTGLTIAAGEEFKVRTCNDWSENYGAATEGTYAMTTDSITKLVGDGSNLTVAASGTYDIYFNHNTAELYLLTVGNSPENVTPAPEPVNWGVIGYFNEWSANVAMERTTTDGLFVAKAVALEAFAEFKFREGDNWDGNNFGAEFTYSAPNSVVNAVAQGGNCSVAEAGTYDLYLDTVGSKIYIMTAGTEIVNATAQTANGQGPEIVVPDANWGVIGSFNEWSANVAALKTSTDGLYVVQGIALEAFAEFKFRDGDNWDGKNFGAEFSYTAPNSVVNAVENGTTNCSVAQAGTYDLYLDTVNAKIYIMTAGTEIVNATAQTANGQGPEVVVPDANWGVIGSFNEWSANVAALKTSTDGLYVVQGIALEAFAEFKFREGDNWDGNNFGAEFAYSAPNSVVNAIEKGNNCSVAQAGTYDLYLDTVNAKIYIMTAGTEIVNATAQTANGEGPAVEVNPEASAWGIVGAFNNWDNDIVLYTTSTEGLLVAEGVTIEAYSEFKFRKDKKWDTNFGAKYAYTTPNSVVEAVSGGSNCSVSLTGTYDIYLDTAKSKIYIMTAGTNISDAKEQTSNGPKPNPTGVSFGIVGVDTNWGNVADIAMDVDQTTGMYKAANVTLSGDFKIRGNNKWDSGFNYGLANGATVAVGKAIGVTNGSNTNITAPAGTYDVYFSYGLDVVYLMTPGSVPAL